jgi:2-phosphoglycerate kinase
VSPPPIYLVGGANGTGKTHFAVRLAATQGLDHTLGTGFVREIVRATTTADDDPVLFEYSFGGHDPVQTLRAQAIRLHAAVRACIARARAEGTSLVVEGTHLLPSLYAHDPDIDGFVLLSAPSAEAWSARLVGPGHTNRRISTADLAAIEKLRDFLRTDAIAHGVLMTVFADNFDAVWRALHESRRYHRDRSWRLSGPVRTSGVERGEFDGM